MPSTVQLNIRIAPELKRQGDAVFAREGLSSSEVVRALWTYAATHNAVPDFLLEDARSSSQEQLDAIQRGAGMVQQLAAAQGLTLREDLPTYHEMREQMYDDLLQEMDEANAAS